MIYREAPSPQDLRHLITCFWQFELEPGDRSPVLHTIPPDGTVSLTWIARFQSLILVGPRTEALRVQAMPGARYIGVRLFPGAVREVLGLEATAIRDAQTTLGMLASEKAAELQQSMDGMAEDLEKFAATISEVVRGWGCAIPDVVAAAMVHRLLENEEATSEELIAGLGVSYRQALRRFQAAVGLTPKEFARLRRIRTACLRALDASPGNLANIAAGTGFADQAHMSREFGRAFGWPPSLVMEYLRQIEHQGI
jgi:AraC-like DNA-binding protein